MSDSGEVYIPPVYIHYIPDDRLKFRAVQGFGIYNPISFSLLLFQV